MARKPKYSLHKGQKERTPEEHRKILEKLDEIQHSRTKHGQYISKKRVYNTFGVSQSKFNSGSAPKKQKKPKIYDAGRHCEK